MSRNLTEMYEYKRENLDKSKIKNEDIIIRYNV